MLNGTAQDSTENGANYKRQTVISAVGVDLVGKTLCRGVWERCGGWGVRWEVAHDGAAVETNVRCVRLQQVLNVHV